MEEEFNGIFPPYKVFYLESISFSCKVALDSASCVAAFLDQFLSGDRTEGLAKDEQLAILDSLQNLILHAGILSKFFWPINKRKPYTTRAKDLRELFCIVDSGRNPLKDRELRNSLEHFDENLDNYLSPGIVGHIIPFYVGNRPRDVPGMPRHIFRAYYFNGGIFAILGKEFKIQPIVDEISRLSEILLCLEQNPT